MNTKKNVFFVGLGALALLILIAFIQDKLDSSCRYVSEYGHTTDYCEILAFSLLPLISLLPFSALLYFFRDEVFRAWWNFARWWVPVIIAATLYIVSIGSEGKYPGANGASLSVYYIYQSQFIIYTFLYTIFIITSLVKIVRAYLRTKENKN